MSKNPIEALLLSGAALTRFPPNSRYHTVPIASHRLPDGRTVSYLRRRFAPQPQSLALLRTYAVQEGDRLDNIAARLLGDPELFWRICDGNVALRPDALTEPLFEDAPDEPPPGFATLRITHPEGVPGTTNG